MAWPTGSVDTTNLDNGGDSPALARADLLSSVQKLNDIITELNAGDPTFGALIADTVQLSGGTGTQGTVSWNADEETLDIIQNGATLQTGQEVQVHCRNNTGVQIDNGTAVMATGTLGASGRITIAPFDGTDPTNAKYIIGVTTTDIANDADGKVTVFGKVRGLDTSSYSEGQVLYASTTVAGAFQTTEPSVPDLNMPLAFVINSHATTGTIMVRVTPIDENHVPDTIPVTTAVDMSPTAKIYNNGANGWRDLFGPIVERGNNSPTLTQFRDGIYLYAAPSNQSKEIHLQFHLDHDYALGTAVYPHLHFTVNSGTANGTVRLAFEYTVAKGHAQATGSTYGSTTTVYAEQAITGATDQYKHFVTELSDIDAIPSTLCEPDTVILLRIYTDTGHANYTYTDNIFMIQADCHYQSNTFNTPNKAPDFYSV